MGVKPRRHHTAPLEIETLLVRGGRRGDVLVLRSSVLLCVCVCRRCPCVLCCVVLCCVVLCCVVLCCAVLCVGALLLLAAAAWYGMLAVACVGVGGWTRTRVVDVAAWLTGGWVRV